MNVVAEANAALKTAIEALNSASAAGEISEVDFPDETQLSAQVMGQMVMAFFGCEGLRPTHKLALVEMAEHMGPDYIGQLRSASAFMAKVDEFH